MTQNTHGEHVFERLPIDTNMANMRARGRDALVDATGNVMLEYGYDAWGKALTGFPKVAAHLTDSPLTAE